MKAILRVAVAAAALSLAGCSTIDKITGSTDDRVLPGQREDAVPGRPSFPSAEERAQTAKTAAGQSGAAGTAQPAEPAPPEPAPCPADDPACAGTTSDDTFSDPQ